MNYVNNNSILQTVKHKLNIEPDYDYFDDDIIDYINSNFLALQQLGIGPDKDFEVKDSSTLWTDFISDDNRLLNSVKIYIKCKVQLQFDPPSSSYLLEAVKQQIAEAEWRMNIRADQIKEESV